MRRIDGWLSHQAQRLDPASTVCREEDGTFVLYYAAQPPVSLGTTFKRARGALFALIRAQENQRV